MTGPRLLTDAQMQHFIAHGCLQLQTELPASFHQTIYERFDALIGGDANINPGNNLLPAVPELNAVFDDPVARGALTSVLGANYVMHPHRALHNNPPGSDAQRMHKDSYFGYLRRVRNHRSRWAMIMYVPQATPIERGPTGVVPGSQYQMQKPDETLSPELAGCLEAGGFLLIHYDVWHRKMKNFTADKRFMMKFEFIRMEEPAAPSWDHADPAWTLQDLPGLDLSAVWQRQWDWLRGERTRPASNAVVDAGGLKDADPRVRLAAINRIAAGADAATNHIAELVACLRDPLEPVAIDAAYALASAGAAAVPALLAVLRGDVSDDTDLDRGSHDGSRADDAIPARSAAYALLEIGAPSVPGLIEIARHAPGARARKLAVFALGECEGTDPDLFDALCQAAADPSPGVRINAVEALGLKQGGRGAVAALTRAIKDADTHVRFSAALSLAQLGPAAAPAVPALKDALDDPNRYVPGYAVEALERIGTKDAYQVLLPYLKTSRWCAHTSPKSIY